MTGIPLASAATAAAARPPLRLGFAGFWDDFDPRDNLFTRLLSTRYRVELSDTPDYLIHSCIGRGRHDHRRHDCVRIFYTGENMAPDWLSTDWAFTFGYSEHPRHYRLPLWAVTRDPAALVRPDGFDPEAVLAAKTRFCGFVVSNPLCRARNEFFRRLSRYRPVDSGGRVLNTLGHRVADKQAFLAECRFTIAFENESSPGYCTEKIADSMLAGSIPIYWGDPLVGRDFDTRSFLSAHDGGSLADLVDRVVAVDRDPDLQRRMLAHPWFPGNRVPRCATAEAILAQFEKIFTTPIVPVSRRLRLARAVGLDRVPDGLASIRRRLRRKYLQATRTA